MKRLFTIALMLCCLAAVLFTSCQKGEDAEASDTITLMFYSPELQAHYTDMAAAYKAETGITLDITVLQADYRSVLSSRINSGDAPDVFMSAAYVDNYTYKDYSYDLTNEDFIKNIAQSSLDGVTLDGRVTGYPFLVQSHSFIYNKKIFRDAGITELPKTLAQYEAAAQKIQAAGIQPFATGFMEWWILPQTSWPAIAPAVANKYGGYAKFVESLNNGTLKFADMPEMNNVFDLLDLIKKYGGLKPNESDFNNQTSMIASGRAAIIHQGNWAEDSIRNISADADIGYLEAPTGNDSNNTSLMVDSNQTIRLFKDSPRVQLAVDWLRWLTTSEYGKNWIPGKIKQLSPVIGAAAPESQIAEATVEMMEAGVPTYSWFWFMFPAGTEEQLGTILQGYCAGNTNRPETLKALDDAYARLRRAAE